MIKKNYCPFSSREMIKLTIIVRFQSLVRAQRRTVIAMVSVASFVSARALNRSGTTELRQAVFKLDVISMGPPIISVEKYSHYYYQVKNTANHH